jgi:hypothetical protein
MLRRCEHLAELDVRARLAARVPARIPGPTRPRLLALPGGRNDADERKPRSGPSAAVRPRRPRPARRPRRRSSTSAPPAERPGGPGPAGKGLATLDPWTMSPHSCPPR